MELSLPGVPGVAMPGTKIWIVNPHTVLAIKIGQFKIGMFDWDGTLSRLRHLWELVMQPTMQRAICGYQTPTADIIQMVEEFISETTGIRTIEQMRGLAEMVRKVGIVPADQILDPWGYKAMYLNELMALVNQRIAQIQDPDDLTTTEDMQIPGSLDVLKAMVARGIEVRIFSGTDQPDVIRESDVLGLGQYFASIHGAAAAHKPDEPEIDKADVLRALLNNGVDSSQVFGGGDGPVEIRVLKEAGCIAIGVASDEEHCLGEFNPAKVDRLVRAGADILIPDWSDWDPLLEYVLKLR